MRVITSQSFLDDQIVEEKKQSLRATGATEVILPVVPVYMDDLYILVDGHHTYRACRELGIPVGFEEVEDEASYYGDVESQNADGILLSHYNDSDWRYLDSGNLVF